MNRRKRIGNGQWKVIGSIAGSDARTADEISARWPGFTSQQARNSARRLVEIGILKAVAAPASGFHARMVWHYQLTEAGREYVATKVKIPHSAV